ncbi:MAG: hypothetical protein ABI432_00185, partial [Flavobacteriales bacterium]
TITSPEKIVSLRLLSADGRVLQEWTTNKNVLELELDEFGLGLYLLQGLSETGQLINCSFIKL